MGIRALGGTVKLLKVVGGADTGCVVLGLMVGNALVGDKRDAVVGVLEAGPGIGDVVGVSSDVG